MSIASFFSIFSKPALKPPVVSLVRYIRFRKMDGEIDSNSGITVLVDLDYRTHTINIRGFSVCTYPEVFSKAKGIEIANTSNRRFYLPMNNGQVGKSGVIYDILHHLSTAQDLSSSERLFVNSLSRNLPFGDFANESSSPFNFDPKFIRG